MRQKIRGIVLNLWVGFIFDRACSFDRSIGITIGRPDVVRYPPITKSQTKQLCCRNARKSELFLSFDTPFRGKERPTPAMPSSLFQDLAQSQLELLAGALQLEGRRSTSANNSKVKSMALYLPQENSNSGQLEFIPAVLYPPPSRDRVFIASGAESGLAPTIPRTLTTLPGFSQARSLLPGYPMVQSGDEPGIGTVEEVLCAVDGTGAGALSVPLFAGSQTTGVLLVYPSIAPPNNRESVWTTSDREQVARAAKTLSLALSMDAERAANEQRQQVFAQALSDNLHQVKNPLQALRTYGKLLQQQLADIDQNVGGRGTRQLLELADHLMIQGERLSARLEPVDAIIDEYAESSTQLPLLPGVRPLSSSPASSEQRWTTPLLPPRNNSEIPGALVSASPSPSPVNGQSSFVLGDFDCEMTFVADILGPTFDSFRAIAEDRHIAFEVEEADDLPGVMVNAEALQEALSNLIDNAMKYVILPKPGSNRDTNPSPRVRVWLFANEPTEESGVTILVEDNGPGIAKGSEEAIFQRGYRDETTQVVGGSGIGLYIAKNLIEKMGGTLGLAGNKTKRRLSGARFQIQLYRTPKQ